MWLFRKETDDGFTVRVQLTGAWSVHLMGEFNGWSTTATPLKRAGLATWEAPLPRGAEENEFLFFVQSHGRPYGRVITDPAERS